MLGKGLNPLIDGSGELLGRSSLGETPKVRRKHRAPDDAHLPCSRLVGEEDQVVVCFIDMFKQSQEEIKRYE